MNFKWKSILFSLILTWPCYALMLYWILRRFHLGGGILFLICFFGGLLIAFIVTFAIQLFSPTVKNQNAIEIEMEKNGYSDRYIELTQAEVDRLSKKGISKYFIRYVLLLSNAYLARKEPYKALDTISIIDPERLKIHTKKNSPMEQNQLLQFFDVQMCISEDLNDIGRAQNVMNDAAPYLQQFYGKTVMADYNIDEIYVTYYCLCGDYNNAMKYADHALMKSVKGAEFVGYGLKAKVYVKFGDFAEARRNLDTAKGYAKKRTAQDYLKMYEDKMIEAMQKQAQNPVQNTAFNQVQNNQQFYS